VREVDSVWYSLEQVMYKRILVAIDTVEPSQVALQTAIALANADRAPLLIVTVHDERFLEGSAAGEDVVDMTEVIAVIEDDEQDGKALLERARSAASAAGVSDVAVRLMSGDPAGNIVDAAIADRTELIVVSTHGRTGLRRFFVGSVAEHVVRHAPCSVLVTRPLTSSNKA
jgi:nucleotide-binding universal stress UspA family protein